MQSQMLRFAALLGLLAAAAGSAACSQEERSFGEGGAGEGGGTGGSGGQVSTGEGPQLVRSVPENGDAQASLDPYAFLYFDRPVSFSEATGKIRVSSDLQADPTVVQALPCPDNDPTCVAAVFPESLQDPAGTGHLPGSTKVTVVIDKSFPDADGKTNDVDTTVTYTTFPLKLDFIDDSGAVTEEAGGLDYDPGSQSLFAVGLTSFQDQSFLVRKIPLPGGVPGAATTAATVDTSATGGSPTYGLDIYGGRLFVAGTYQYRAYQFDDLGMNPPSGPITYNQTGLPAPNDMLYAVNSTAWLDDHLYIGCGYYAASPLTALIRLTPAGSWETWLDFAGAIDLSDGFTIAPAIEPDGKRFIYLGSPAEAIIYKIDVATKAIVNQHEFESLYDPQLRVDSRGRLYVGTNNDGLRVFTTAGPSGFTEIVSRTGIEAGRFGLREEGNTVHVYFMRFRGDLKVGTTSITFVN